MDQDAFTDALTDAVITAERALLDPATRSDRSRVAALLADDFREIGASGRLFDRAAIIDALAAERPAPADGPAPEAVPAPVPAPTPVPRELDELVATRIVDDLVLLTYRLRGPGGVSRRSSLWRLTARGPRITFHQGTPAPDEA